MGERNCQSFETPGRCFETGSLDGESDVQTAAPLNPGNKCVYNSLSDLYCVVYISLISHFIYLYPRWTSWSDSNVQHFQSSSHLPTSGTQYVCNVHRACQNVIILTVRVKGRMTNCHIETPRARPGGIPPIENSHVLWLLLFSRGIEFYMYNPSALCTRPTC